MWLTNPIIVQHDAWSAKDNKIVSKYRMVQDLRKVNEKLVKMSYPLIAPREFIAKVSRGYNVFSVQDLKGFFHQIPVCADSRPLTTFCVQTNNQYRCL